MRPAGGLARFVSVFPLGEPRTEGIGAGLRAVRRNRFSGLGNRRFRHFQLFNTAVRRKVPDGRALSVAITASQISASRDLWQPEGSSSARRLAVSMSSDYRADGAIGGRKQVDREDRRALLRRRVPIWLELDLSAVEASQVVTLATGDREPVGAAATRTFDCQ